MCEAGGNDLCLSGELENCWANAHAMLVFKCSLLCMQPKTASMPCSLDGYLACFMDSNVFLILMQYDINMNGHKFCMLRSPSAGQVVEGDTTMHLHFPPDSLTIACTPCSYTSESCHSLVAVLSMRR